MIKVKEEITDEELRSFTMVVNKRYGIDFTNYETKSLKRGVSRVIAKHNIGSLIDLWSKVLKDKNYFLVIMDDLTVNLTELFRNPEIWMKLRDEYLNKFMHQKALKVWHAGCSTGEEVYSMALVLLETNMLSKSEIIATDLSTRVLEKAMAGEYSLVLEKKYLKTLEEYRNNASLEDIFDICDEKMTVKPSFKKYMTFEQHNLVNDRYPAENDIIFCRNVMIYFDLNLKKRVLKKLHDSLSDEGYLIIGYYDMLPDDSKELFEVVDSKTRIYKKKKIVS